MPSPTIAQTVESNEYDFGTKSRETGSYVTKYILINFKYGISQIHYNRVNVGT